MSLCAGCDSSRSGVFLLARVQMVNPIQVRSQHCGMCKSLGGGGHRTTASSRSKRCKPPPRTPYFPRWSNRKMVREWFLLLEQPCGGKQLPSLYFSVFPLPFYVPIEICQSKLTVEVTVEKIAHWNKLNKKIKIPGEIHNVLVISCAPSALKAF